MLHITVSRLYQVDGDSEGGFEYLEPSNLFLISVSATRSAQLLQILTHPMRQVF